MAFISVITLRRFTLIKVSYAVLYSNSNSSNGGLVNQYKGLSSKDLHRATFYILCGTQRCKGCSKTSKEMFSELFLVSEYLEKKVRTF